MKSLPPSLQSHLDSGTTTLAWCWRLTRGDGLVQGFTDHDRDLAFDGTTFAAATGFTATEIKDAVGLAVDNLEVESARSAPTASTRTTSPPASSTMRPSRSGGSTGPIRTSAC